VHPVAAQQAAPDNDVGKLTGDFEGVCMLVTLIICPMKCPPILSFCTIHRACEASTSTRPAV
jgi:hypothetical protein